MWKTSCVAGEYKKDELLESARSGNEEKMMSLLTSLNVNCHASDGRKVSLLGSKFGHIFLHMLHLHCPGTIMFVNFGMVIPFKLFCILIAARNLLSCGSSTCVCTTVHTLASGRWVQQDPHCTTYSTTRGWCACQGQRVGRWCLFYWL